MTRPDKREHIMQAAEKLFTSRRFHEITLDDVAQAAQVGKGTIYRHFKDKDDLFFQISTSGFDELCDLLHRKVPETAPFGKQLVGACVAISAFFERRRQLFRMMQAEEDRMSWCHGSLRERWATHRRKLVAAVAAIIAKGVAEGAIRSDIGPEVLAGFLLGMLRTWARDLAGEAHKELPHEFVVHLFCDGAGRRSGGKPARSVPVVKMT